MIIAAERDADRRELEIAMGLLRDLHAQMYSYPSRRTWDAVAAFLARHDAREKK